MSQIIYANGKTYDASKIIKNHPGGEKCLLRKIGQDCTKDYNFHSKKGKKEWKKYEINKKKSKKSWCCVIF